MVIPLDYNGERAFRQFPVFGRNRFTRTIISSAAIPGRAESPMEVSAPFVFFGKNPPILGMRRRRTAVPGRDIKKDPAQAQRMSGP